MYLHLLEMDEDKEMPIRGLLFHCQQLYAKQLEEAKTSIIWQLVIMRIFHVFHQSVYSQLH